MSLVYRRAREQDLERAQELVVRSINDLTERHGFGPMAVLRPTQFQSSHSYEPMREAAMAAFRKSWQRE
jgi:hypothetical protein